MKKIDKIKELAKLPVSKRNLVVTPVKNEENSNSGFGESSNSEEIPGQSESREENKEVKASTKRGKSKGNSTEETKRDSDTN